MSMSAKIAVQFYVQKTVAEGNAQAQDTVDVSLTTSFVDGTGAGAANKEWNDYRTLPGASESIDLSGALTNRIGETVIFTKIKGFYASNPTGNNDLTIGGGANAWATMFGSTLILKPGTAIALKTSDANGYAVTAGTGDICLIAGTNGQSYEIGFIGE